MVPLSIVTVALPLLVFAVAGVLVYSRSGLNRYHVPVVSLALFAVTGGLAVPVAAVSIDGGGLGAGLLFWGLIVIGIPLTLGLGWLAVASYRTESFRAPAAAVSGITVAVGGSAVVALQRLLVVSVLAAGVVWVALSGFEPLKGD